MVRHARARRMRLSVDPRSGKVKLTLPPRASLKKGMDWARTQQGWIAAQQAKMPEARPFAPGERIPLGDAEVEIMWPAPGAGRTPRLAGDRLLCGGPREGLERRIERWLRQAALDLRLKPRFDPGGNQLSRGEDLFPDGHRISLIPGRQPGDVVN